MQLTSLPKGRAHQLPPGLGQRSPAQRLRPLQLAPLRSLRAQHQAFRYSPCRRFSKLTAAAAAAGGDPVPSSSPQPLQVLTASQIPEDAANQQQSASRQTNELLPASEQISAAIPSPSSSPSAPAPAAAPSTIENIDLLTGKSDASSSNGGNSSNSTSPNHQEEQQQSSETDPVWASAIKTHFLGILGAITAAWVALTSRLGSFPAWVAAQKLKQLREAADEAPHDPERQAAYLAALNPKHPKDVLARVESKQYATNPAVVVEYLKALVATDRLGEYAQDSGKVGGEGVGVATASGSGDHRSLAELLQELQRAAAGQQQKEQPGASGRRPLHVVLQVGGCRWRWQGEDVACWAGTCREKKGC